MHMNMFLSNETGGRDFPTFDIYCGPSLDPSYLCSLNSFKIVSASRHQESASSIHIYFIYSFYVQDVDFVSPPAPTSSAGDGQRGFRLEYRQIPCSTWFVKIGFVKVKPLPLNFPQSRVCQAFDLMWKYTQQVWVGSQWRFNKKQLSILYSWSQFQCHGH